MKIVAHRGESLAAPENTMPAFELAWARGAKWIELDVHLSRDGVVVVHHDGNTGAMGDRKLVIADSTFAQLKEVDLGIKKARRWKNTRMSSLAEVIAAMPRRKGFGMLIEIKSNTNPAIVKAIKKVLADSGRRNDQFAVISFFEDIMQKISKALPNIETRLLVDNKRDEQGNPVPSADELAKKILKMGLDSIGPAWGLVDEEFVATMKQSGIKIHPWTVDKVGLARKLVAVGVDSITSNCPQRLRNRLT